MLLSTDNKRAERSVSENDHAENRAAHTVHALQDASRVVRAVLRGQAFRLQPAGRGVQHDDFNHGSVKT